MEDFYKQFKENLENRPEPEIGKHLWKNLEKDLDKQADTPKAAFPWWWAAIAATILFLLLGTTIFSTLEMQKVNAKMAAFEQKTKIDTIVQTKIVYQVDTIFQTNTIQKEVIRYVASAFSTTPLLNNQQPNNQPFYESKNTITPFYLEQASRGIFADNYSSSLYFADYLQKKQVESSTLTDIETKELTTAISFTDFDALDKIGLNPLVYDWATLADLDITIPMVDIKQRKTLAQQLYPMRPKGFSLGLMGGLVKPTSKVLADKFGYATGIEAAIKFSPALQLWANASFLDIILESDELNATIGIPSTAPPSDEFQFAQATAEQPTLQYSMGMQYFFNANRKWKPFLGAGYAAVKILPYDVTYEFEIPDQDIKWEIDEEVSKGDLITNFLVLKGGLAYKISDNWELQVQGIYRRNLEKEGLQSPDIVSLQTGVNYSF